MAEIWAAGVQVYFDQLSKDQTKDEAIAQEDQLVEDLVEKGLLLANVHHNSNVKSVADIASAILAKRKPWPFLENFEPIDRYTREMLALRRTRRHRG